MQRKTKRRLAAVVLVAAVAAIGGNAFTNSVSGEAEMPVQAGYASATVHGAHATQVIYNYSSNKEYLANIYLDLLGDQPGAQVRIGFNKQDPVSVCVPREETEPDPSRTEYDCPMPPGFEVYNIHSTEVTVIDNDPVAGV